MRGRVSCILGLHLDGGVGKLKEGAVGFEKEWLDYGSVIEEN